MKNILLIMLIFLSLLACSGGKTVQLPDKNLEIKDNKIYYNGGLFTGEIKAIDKESGAEEPGRFSASVKNGEIEGKVALLAEDTDFTYNIKDGKINGVASTTGVEISYKDDEIQKCSSSIIPMEMVNSFCDIIKKHPDGESFPTTGKELQKRTLGIIERLNSVGK